MRGIRGIRIIAGTLKGRRLESPDWPGLRPTSDKLRETLFNVLGAAVVGARVLDGYAGTGAVGIEALSRGAAHVTFVERDPRAAALIEAQPAALRRHRAAMLLSARVLRARRPAREPWARRRGDRSTSSFSTRRTARASWRRPSPRRRACTGGHPGRRRAREARPGAAAGGVAEAARELSSGDSALAFYRSL